MARQVKWLSDESSGSPCEGPLLLHQGERLRRGSIAIVLLQLGEAADRGGGNIKAFGAVAGDKFVGAISQRNRHPLLVRPSP